MEQSVINRLVEYKARSLLEESSIELLDRAARWFVELHSDMDTRMIQFGHIDDYKRWLAKGRSTNSANIYLAIFKPFFAWLAKRRYIEFDPCDGVRLYPHIQRKFEQYSIDEIQRILKIADQRWRTMVCLALCSMREAEILNLVVSDIDFDKNLILISAKTKTLYTWPWGIKDKDQAYIGIDDSISRLLIECIDLLGESKQPYVVLKERYWRRNLQLQAEGRLSHRKRNGPWGNFNRDFRALLKRANVKPKRFHDLRGTFCTERYNDGYNLKELQYLMRHSSIRTTARYIRNVDEKKLVARSGRTFKKHYETYVP